MTAPASDNKPSGESILALGWRRTADEDAKECERQVRAQIVAALDEESDIGKEPNKDTMKQLMMMGIDVARSVELAKISASIANGQSAEMPPEHRLEGLRTRLATLRFSFAADADDAGRLAAYRELDDDLHQFYDGVLHEPLPARLRGGWNLAQPSWLARLRSRLAVDLGVWAPSLAGIAVMLVLSGAPGWLLKGEPEPIAEAEAPADFTRQAAHAHMLYAPDMRHPVEFWADQRENLLQWLSARLRQPVHAPELASIGFALVGGRLLPSAGQPAAQLMYEDANGQRITLYLRERWGVPESSPLSDAQEDNVQFASEGPISMVYWMKGPLAYALIGEMDREQLFASARTIQHELQSPDLLPLAPDPATSSTTERF